MNIIRCRDQEAVEIKHVFFAAIFTNYIALTVSAVVVTYSFEKLCPYQSESWAVSAEQLFAKIKAILRKIAAYALKNAAYTVESLCKAIVLCLDEIPRSECA